MINRSAICHNNKFVFFVVFHDVTCTKLLIRIQMDGWMYEHLPIIPYFKYE